ncbi:MAG: class I SAM-dependent methyltransferase [Bacteroidota bacterium]
MIQHLGVVSVLETGTSLGLNTLYLAESNSQVATIEGCPSIAKLAKDNFDQFSRKNPRLAIGKIRDILEQEILINRPDFYFLDADHRSAEVLFCLNLIMKHTPKAKCIVIHDIYWSPDMRKLWNSIIKDTRFNLTIDLFQAGLIFLNHPIEKQHFTLRF